MKYVKHLLIIFVFASTTVLAASWSGTGAIKNGSVIQASSLKANLDYLYDRSWSRSGNTLSTNKNIGIKDTTPERGLTLDVEGSVGATQYCDQDGANCISAGALKPPRCTGKGKALQFDGTQYNCITIEGGSTGGGPVILGKESTGTWVTRETKVGGDSKVITKTYTYNNNAEGYGLINSTVIRDYRTKSESKAIALRFKKGDVIKTVRRTIKEGGNPEKTTSAQIFFNDTLVGTVSKSNGGKVSSIPSRYRFTGEYTQSSNTDTAPKASIRVVRDSDGGSVSVLLLKKTN